MFSRKIVAQSGKIVVRNFSAQPFAGSLLPVDHVTDRVVKVVKTVKFAPPTVNPNTQFSDLEFDSLLRQDLNEKLAAEFCVKVPQEVAEGFTSVAAAVNYFSSHPKAR
jgi:acyl carrier protein